MRANRQDACSGRGSKQRPRACVSGPSTRSRISRRWPRRRGNIDRYARDRCWAAGRCARRCGAGVCRWGRAILSTISVASRVAVLSIVSVASCVAFVVLVGRRGRCFRVVLASGGGRHRCVPVPLVVLWVGPCVVDVAAIVLHLDAVVLPVAVARCKVARRALEHLRTRLCAVWRREASVRASFAAAAHELL